MECLIAFKVDDSAVIDWIVFNAVLAVVGPLTAIIECVRENRRDIICKNLCSTYIRELWNSYVPWRGTTSENQSNIDVFSKILNQKVEKMTKMMPDKKVNALPNHPFHGQS